MVVADAPFATLVLRLVPLLRVCDTGESRMAHWTSVLATRFEQRGCQCEGKAW